MDLVVSVFVECCVFVDVAEGSPDEASIVDPSLVGKSCDSLSRPTLRASRLELHAQCPETVFVKGSESRSRTSTNVFQVFEVFFSAPAVKSAS